MRCGVQYQTQRPTRSLCMVAHHRPWSLEPGRVAQQKARLTRKANTEGAPLVWVLDDYVGIGNALDAYVRAVIEARHRRRSLIIKSPILRNLCRIVGVRCINQIVADPTHWLICAQVACEGLVGAKRDDPLADRANVPRKQPQGQSDHCVYSCAPTFGWRNAKYPPDYDLSPHNGLTAARRAILREFLPRREHGELVTAVLACPGKGVRRRGASRRPSRRANRYAVALHLRTFDFIEGKNATDAAAFDWLQTRKARFKWTCLVRRLRALGLGCSPNQKVFLAGRTRARSKMSLRA